VKLVLPLAQTEEFEGCAVIEGAVFTVKVAAFEVAGGVHVPESILRYV